jgi:hypothetical protein
MASVPDFFQQRTPEARLLQLRWIVEKFDLSSSLLRRVVGVDPRNTPSNLMELSEQQTRAAADLWTMALHLWSFAGSDAERASAILHTPLTVPGSLGSKLRDGESPAQHMEQWGLKGVEDVTDWLMSFRFSDHVRAQRT